jgi:hypothetical protein
LAIMIRPGQAKRRAASGTRSPGGSSGGEAATLAAGLSALGAGSDIAGSLRNPAHYSGVYGHKPTWGLISTRGHAPPGIMTPTDIYVVGPMARHAEDLGLALRTLPDPTYCSGPPGGSRCRRRATVGSASFASPCGHPLRYAGSTVASLASLIAPSMPLRVPERWSTMQHDPR